MKKYLVPGVLVLAAFSASNLSASQVACPVATTVDVLQGFNTSANGCYSQDKLFWNFNYTPTGSAGAASTVIADLIFEQIGSGLDIHGWNFSSSSWIQGTSGPAQFTIGYTMEVCPSGSACFGNVVAGTVIDGADAVYAPVSIFPAGNAVVTWTWDGGGTDTVTLTKGSPGPDPFNGDIGLGAGILGPINVEANFSGTGAITQLTLRFYEDRTTFSPEPVTMALVGGGLVAFGLFARKRRKKA